MKPMRSLILVLLCLCLLAGCREQPPVTTAPVATAAPTTLTTQPVWPGYVDAKTDYTYYYTEGRELEWEEDILYFANSLLTDHLMLRNRQFVVELPIYETDAANFYDEALQKEIVAQVNQLIPEIENLTDKQIYYRLQYILGLFDDAHTRLEYYEGDYFPILFLPFREEGETVFYAVVVPKKHSAVLNARLEAINGYSVAEIIEMIRPYSASETEYGLIDSLGGAGVGAELLSFTSMLEAAGVIELDATKAVYTLTAQDGTVHELTLHVGMSTDLVGQWYMQTYSVPYEYYRTDNFWFREDLAENTLYVRILSFQVETYEGYGKLSDALFQAYRAHGKYGKIILDLRHNGGGYQGNGFDVLIRRLAGMECDEFYILIDGRTYSMSTIFAGEVVARRGDVILVGTPAGESAGFFAGIYEEDYIMPNCGVEFKIPTSYYQPFPAGEDNTIVPDWLIYTTLEEYVSGIDVVLETVLTTSYEGNS